MIEFHEKLGIIFMKLLSAYLLCLLGVSPLLAKTYTLQDAVKTALTNNQQQNISEQERAIATAKYHQALSVDYPTLDISLVANRADEPLIDEVSTTFSLPPLLGGATLPINYIHTIMGRDTLTAKATAKYALYTGGKISALQEQAKAGVKYAEETLKLSADTIILNVRKYYAAVVFAQRVQKLMQDTVDRMQITYELTETFYKGGSMKVKKTDYLRAKMTLLNMKSILESMKNTTQLAKNALVFEMGIGSDKTIEIDVNSLPQVVMKDSLEEYFNKLYLGNHQLKQLKIGMQVKEAKMKEAQSGYLPSVGLYANGRTLHNNEHGGLINSQNNDSWNIGIAVKYNLFSGGLTKAQLQEAKAQKLKLQAQEAYAKSGLQTKAKSAFLKTKTALKQIKIMQEATQTAKENSDLNFRAYKEEMVETKDVLESQFLCSLTEAAYYKTLYEARVNEAQLEYLIGTTLK